jgi:DNA invertase Pin-like site-specific DNA recombinase
MSSRAIAVPRAPAIPVAYLRRSHAQASNTGAVSHEIQRQKIETLAGEDAPRLVWIEDWGRSGRREKQNQRAAYAQLRRMLDAGEVSAIYTWSLSRLARSLTELNDLAHACADKGVPINCADGTSPDVSTSSGRLILSLLGAIHQYQAEWTQEAAANSLAVRRANGGVVGSTPYGAKDGEDPAILVEYFKAAGSFHQAAIALNAAGIMTRRGNRWTATTLGRILRRPDIGAAQNQPIRGVRAGRETRMFSKLLRCHCGAFPMTSMPNRPGVSYYCRAATLDPSHPYPRTIPEHRLLPWMQREALRFGSHGVEARNAGIKNQQKRARLEAERDALVPFIRDRRLSPGKIEEELTRIDSELAALGPVDRAIAEIVLTPVVRWDAEPGVVNTRLRAMWRHVQLGADLMPVSASWVLSKEEHEAAEDAQTAVIRANW